MESTKSYILSPGHIINNRWKVKKRIGKGGFGEVYSATDLDGGSDVAVKIESNSRRRKVLKWEAYVLRRLEVQRRICKMYEFGTTDSWSYIAMELKGKSMSQLRKEEDCNYSCAATYRVGMEMLEAIEGVHKAGFIHRDIKPGNFVVDSNEQGRRNLFIVDFGLSREYASTVLSGYFPFRGTVRYASANSHNNKHCGRRDDLWSLLYILVEFITGSLPWHKLRHKAVVGKMKEKFNKKVANLPNVIRNFIAHISSLSSIDQPDYVLLREILLDGIIHANHSILTGIHLHTEEPSSEYINQNSDRSSSENNYFPPSCCLSNKPASPILHSIDCMMTPQRSTSPCLRRSTTSWPTSSGDDIAKQSISCKVPHDSGMGTSQVPSPINLVDTLKRSPVVTPVPPSGTPQDYGLVRAMRMRRYYIPE